MALRGRTLVVLRRIILLNFCDRRPRIHESQSALLTLHNRKKFFTDKLAIRHFIHDSVPVGPAQIASYGLQVSPALSPTFPSPAVWPEQGEPFKTKTCRISNAARL